MSVNFYSLACGYLVSSISFVEETILSPICMIDTLVGDIYGYFCALSSVPLVYTSVLMPILCYLDYSNFVIIYFEMKKHDTSNFVVLSQVCLAYFRSCFF